MKRIPISAAKRIADDYGYDQVVVIARKVGEKSDPHGEHVTTYGVDREHCAVAARVGDFIKHKIMGWPVEAQP
jgi:acetylornithine/succinyldiaminopimelate/putrescine aminotransferase